MSRKAREPLTALCILPVPVPTRISTPNARCQLTASSLR